MGPEKYGLELPLRTVDVSGPCPTNAEGEKELCVQSLSEDSLVMPAECDPWR